MKNKKKIVAVHLLNDHSGSPRVLATAIAGFRQQGWEVDLYTSKGPGFLSACDARFREIPYRFHEHKWRRLWALLRVQLWLFGAMWRYWRQPQVVFWLNTLMPFGAALAARLMGKRVVYHIHETSVRPLALKRWLRFVARHTASHAVFVSRFLKEREALPGVPATVVYNALPQEFVQQAASCEASPAPRRPFTVLMLCSLKDYKGVGEFVALAPRLPHCQFELVLNACMGEIKEWFDRRRLHLPDNLVVFPAQRHVHPFYQRADLVCNLSHPERWVETFGMTLLEAMSYGIPVIAPPAGGPAELVRQGENGFLIHPKNLDRLAQAIELLRKDESLYATLSAQARAFAARFSVSDMQRKLSAIAAGYASLPPDNHSPHAQDAALVKEDEP